MSAAKAARRKNNAVTSKLDLPAAEKRHMPSFSLPVPEWPYHMHGFVRQLNAWADALSSGNRKELLQEADYLVLAEHLRLIAALDDARRNIFLQPRSRGRSDRTMRRDYLISYEFWIRREISKLGKGREKLDLAATANNWRRRGVSEAVVRRVRSKYRKQCEKAIAAQIELGWREWQMPPKDVLLELLKLIDAMYTGGAEREWVMEFGPSSKQLVGTPIGD